jgi:hypothetical protein
MASKEDKGLQPFYEGTLISKESPLQKRVDSISCDAIMKKRQCGQNFLVVTIKLTGDEGGLFSATARERA